MVASSIFTKFLRAILLNEIVFNSDDLILQVLKGRAFTLITAWLQNLIITFDKLLVHAWLLFIFL